jgi:hypothetical protein
VNPSGSTRQQAGRIVRPAPKRHLRGQAAPPETGISTYTIDSIARIVLGADVVAGVVASALGAQHEIDFDAPAASPRKRSRPDRFGRIRPGKTNRAQVEEAEDRFLREGILARLPVPDWLSEPALHAYLRERNNTPAIRELRKRVDDEAVRIMEAKESSELSPHGGVEEGLKSLRIETNALRRRERLLATQRFGQLRWATQCSLRGEVPLELERELSRGYFWELVQLAAVGSLTAPRALDEAKRAESRRALDQVVRAYRGAFSAVAAPADDVMRARERMVLLLDTWNSTTLDAVYEPKAWQATRVPTDFLGSCRRDLNSATSTLEHELVRGYGQPALLSILRPAAEELPMARELLTALVAEDAV